MIAVAPAKVAATMSGVKELGSMCRIITRPRDAPRERAAVT